MSSKQEPELAQNIEPANPIAVANKIVLQQLSNAPKTRAQLAEKLTKKNTPLPVIESVLDRFTELGYIDDFAYAQMFIRSKMLNKHLSTRALRYELMKCGIDKEVIAIALAELSDETELETAQALVHKKLRSMRNLDEDSKVRRLMAALARKGFSPAISSQAIAKEVASESVVQEQVDALSP